jgi:hypothetical protein
MPNLNELLAVIDNYKRRAKRNLSDLIESPSDQYAEMLADRLPQLTEEMINDPANFLPGGGLLGSVAKKSTTPRLVDVVPKYLVDDIKNSTNYRVGVAQGRDADQLLENSLIHSVRNNLRLRDEAMQKYKELTGDYPQANVDW